MIEKASMDFDLAKNKITEMEGLLEDAQTDMDKSKNMYNSAKKDVNSMKNKIENAREVIQKLDENEK